MVAARADLTPDLFATRIARNPMCSAELLHHMALRAESVDKTYRAVARHPHASGETLVLCLEDAQARHSAAAHPHLPVPVRVMEELAPGRSLGAGTTKPAVV